MELQGDVSIEAEAEVVVENIQRKLREQKKIKSINAWISASVFTGQILTKRHRLVHPVRWGLTYYLEWCLTSLRHAFVMRCPRVVKHWEVYDRATKLSYNFQVKCIEKIVYDLPYIPYLHTFLFKWISLKEAKIGTPLWLLLNQCPYLLGAFFWLGRCFLHQQVPPVELHHWTVLNVAQHLGHRLIRVALQQ